MRQSQIPLAWEGWVAQPVDRSQAFTGRVPTSGNLGGTAFLCMLCSSLFGIPWTRVVDIDIPTVHTKDGVQATMEVPTIKYAHVPQRLGPEMRPDSSKTRCSLGKNNHMDTTPCKGLHHKRCGQSGTTKIALGPSSVSLCTTLSNME